ncbi:MAG: hypothetical protein JST54_25470 [Deltaproteobacteria bacterium]|nr:hypothetical protein [Deltaproteobacteria bacterium]
MVNASRNPSRRHFDDPEAVASWLGARLDASEAERRRAFLRLPERSKLR